MIGAVSSIRLLVVSADSPPKSSRTCSPCRSTAPHPPGPGLGVQPPSVWMVTTSWFTRTSCRAAELGAARLARGQDAELVAVGVRHHDPADVALTDVDPLRTERLEAGYLGLLIAAHRRVHV